MYRFNGILNRMLVWFLEEIDKMILIFIYKNNGFGIVKIN